MTKNMVNQISVKAPGTPEAKLRLAYVDIAKFIGIICMVYGHSGLPEVLQKYIHIFHMPLFFILSGYTFDLYKHLKDPLRFFISRVKMILLPYMVFSMLIYLMRFCLSLKGIGSCIGFSDFLKILFNTCATDSFGGTVQWYLVCIFFTELISFTVMLLISRLSRRENISLMIISVVMLIFAIIGYAWYPITQIRLPMAIDTAFTGVVFYYIGFLFRRYKVVSKLQKYKISLFNSFVITSVIGLLTTYISMRELIFGNPIIFYFDAVAISLAILGVSDWIASTEHSSFVYRWILYLGRNTLLILIFNYIVIYGLNIIEKRLLPDTQLVAVLLMVLRPIIVLLIITVISYVIRRFFPFLIGSSYSKSHKQRSIKS